MRGMRNFLTFVQVGILIAGDLSSWRRKVWVIRNLSTSRIKYFRIEEESMIIYRAMGGLCRAES